MGQWVHRLRDVDPDSMTATCEFCGPVRIRRKGSVLRCTNGIKQHKGTSRGDLFARRLRLFGLDREAFNRMVLEQTGRCAVCSDPLDANKGVNGLHIDHDHKCCPDYRKCCGKCVRGILCPRCNKALGFLDDDLNLLANAIKYLQKKSPA